MRSWLFVRGLVCGAIVACGGADQTPLLGDSGQPEQDATQVVDTGIGVDAGQKDAPTVEDAPTVIDVVTVDVPNKPADSKIHCGTTTCSAQNEVCCYHVGNTTKQFECVSSANDCTGTDDVPITCGSSDNCVSEGLAGDVCCGLPNGPQNPSSSCGNFSGASAAQCQTSCDAQNGEFEVGCSIQQQNCSDSQQQCITSQCTLPGFSICR